MDVVAKLEGSWVATQEAVPVPGYVYLVSQTHAVNLHDLPEAAAFAVQPVYAPREFERVRGAFVVALASNAA